MPVIFPERRARRPNIPDSDRIAGQDPAKRRAVGTFLDRVVHEVAAAAARRPPSAINYSTTGAAIIGGVFDEVLKSPEPMELDSIGAEPGPPCRVCGSDRRGTGQLSYRRQVQTTRMVYRFTVDVSDVVPVMVGPMRSWSVR